MTLLPWPDLPRATIANYRKWRDTQQGRDVYADFRAKAREIRGKGWTHFGAKAIAESIRVDAALRDPANAPKVNNSWVALMARELMDEDYVFKGFFETRKRRAG